MAIELGMVNVTIRRDALRRVGLEEALLERVAVSRMHTSDEHLVNLTFMSSMDADLCVEDLGASGLEEPEDIAGKGTDWLDHDTLRAGPPICHLRRAWLRGTDPDALAEMPWLKEKRDRIPGPRPWCSPEGSGPGA